LLGRRHVAPPRGTNPVSVQMALEGAISLQAGASRLVTARVG